MRYEKMLEELGAYFDKISIGKDPETEEEFIYSLEFWGKFMVNQAASEYGRPPLGIIPHDTNIDGNKVIKNFSPKCLSSINHLVNLACKKFNLSHPGSEKDNSRIAFEKWFNSVAEKHGLKVRYEERIFNTQT